MSQQLAEQQLVPLWTNVHKELEVQVPLLDKVIQQFPNTEGLERERVILEIVSYIERMLSILRENVAQLSPKIEEFVTLRRMELRELTLKLIVDTVAATTTPE